MTRLIPHFPSLLASLSLLGWTYFQWKNLPEKIPLRFSMSGIVDEYGEKGFSLWVIPLALCFVSSLLVLVFFLALNSQQQEKMKIHFLRLSLATGVFFSSVQFGLLQSVRAIEAAPLFSSFHFGFGFLLLILSLSLRHLPPNPYIGIRIPSTKASESNWIQTHQRASLMFMGLGLLLLGLSLTSSPLWFPLAAFLLVGMYLIFYSLRLADQTPSSQ